MKNHYMKKAVSFGISFCMIMSCMFISCPGFELKAKASDDEAIELSVVLSSKNVTEVNNAGAKIEVVTDTAVLSLIRGVQSGNALRLKFSVESSAGDLKELTDIVVTGDKLIADTADSSLQKIYDITAAPFNKTTNINGYGEINNFTFSSPAFKGTGTGNGNPSTFYYLQTASGVANDWLSIDFNAPVSGSYKVEFIYKYNTNRATVQNYIDEAPIGNALNMQERLGTDAGTRIGADSSWFYAVTVSDEVELSKGAHNFKTVLTTSGVVSIQSVIITLNDGNKVEEAIDVLYAVSGSAVNSILEFSKAGLNTVGTQVINYLQSAASVGDWVSFEFFAPAGTTYKVEMIYKGNNAARATIQNSIDETPVGAPFDMKGTTGTNFSVDTVAANTYLRYTLSEEFVITGTGMHTFKSTATAAGTITIYKIILTLIDSDKTALQTLFDETTAVYDNAYLEAYSYNSTEIFLDALSYALDVINGDPGEYSQGEVDSAYNALNAAITAMETSDSEYAVTISGTIYENWIVTIPAGKDDLDLSSFTPQSIGELKVNGRFEPGSSIDITVASLVNNFVLKSDNMGVFTGFSYELTDFEGTEFIAEDLEGLVNGYDEEMYLTITSDVYSAALAGIYWDTLTFTVDYNPAS